MIAPSARDQPGNHTPSHHHTIRNLIRHLFSPFPQDFSKRKKRIEGLVIFMTAAVVPADPTITLDRISHKSNLLPNTSPNLAKPWQPIFSLGAQHFHSPKSFTFNWGSEVILRNYSGNDVFDVTHQLDSVHSTSQFCQHIFDQRPSSRNEI